MEGCGGPSVRRLLEEAYDALESGSVVAAVAPTSYGKTVASPWMWRRAREEGLAGGLIHVAPLRSLVRRAFEDIFKPCRGRLQMHGAGEDVKSPYFFSSLVITTLDSFLWNLYRIPVAEALSIQRGSSMGHYYPTLFAIFTSLVVFDEGHMYLWEEPAQRDPASTGTSATIAAIAGLTWAGVPVIVETATAQPEMLVELKRAVARARGRTSIKALKAPRDSTSCPYLDRLREKAGALDVVEDPDWESHYKIPWKTYIKDSWDAILDEIADDASSGPVLVVANTVKEAVNLYRRLRGRVGRITLIHGRLSNSDRIRAEDELRSIEDKGGVIVATQVAEAGLDANVAVVYTAAAPLESMVQRAGRACRRGEILDSCRGQGGKVVIVREGSSGPYLGGTVAKAVELVSKTVSGGPRSLDWRFPCNHGSTTGYGSLIAQQLTESLAVASADLVEDLLESYLRSDARPWVLLWLMNRAGLCGLVRDSIMIEVDVGGSAVPVPLQWVLSNADKLLEFGENEREERYPVLVVEWSRGREGGIVEGFASELWSAWMESKQSSSCGRLVNALARDVARALENAGVDKAAYIARLKVREGAYKPGLGLLV